MRSDMLAALAISLLLFVVAYEALLILEQRKTIDHLRALIFPFDRDRDGRPGGSKPSNKGA